MKATYTNYKLLNPRSLGRRRGKVRVGVRVGVIGVVFGVGVSVGLILLLWVLHLGAPRRTIIRHPIIGGDILLGEVVGRQFILAGR